MTRVINKIWHASYLYTFLTEIKELVDEFVVTVRSRSSNSFTGHTSTHGQNHRGKTRNERKTSRSASRLIPIRHKQVRNKKPRKHHNNRKWARGAKTHRPNDTDASLRKKPPNRRNPGTPMPNMQSNSTKRTNVWTLPEENRGNHHWNMCFLPLNLTQHWIY